MQHLSLFLHIEVSKIAYLNSINRLVDQILHARECDAWWTPKEVFPQGKVVTIYVPDKNLRHCLLRRNLVARTAMWALSSRDERANIERMWS